MESRKQISGKWKELYLIGVILFLAGLTGFMQLNPETSFDSGVSKFTALWFFYIFLLADIFMATCLLFFVDRIERRYR